MASSSQAVGTAYLRKRPQPEPPSENGAEIFFAVVALIAALVFIIMVLFVGPK